MPPSNHDIADAFDRLADLLEVRRESPFRIRAWRRAARSVEAHPEPLAGMVAAGRDPAELAGIGKDIAGAVRELVATGRLGRLAALEREMPASLLELRRLPGLGPVRVERLWRELGVATVEDLASAAGKGRIARLSGFGPALERRLLAAVAARGERPERWRIDLADREAAPLTEWLREDRAVARAEVAGALRRRCETVAGLALAVASASPERVVARLRAWPRAATVERVAPGLAVVTTRRGLAIRVRIAAPDRFGLAWIVETGSVAHLAALREHAAARGVGFPDRDAAWPAGGPVLAGDTEDEVYAALGLSPIPPELREGRGEVGLAAAGALSSLVTVEGIRGDLQMHTTWSDGRERLETMADACRERGLEYVAVTDHGPTLPMIQGLDRERMLRQWREIEEVQRRFPDLRILRSAEVDVLADGTLDLDDDLLAGLDLVVIATHTALRLPRAEQTRRLLAAVAHPRAHILAHPTARRLGRRDPIEVDLDAVLAACARHRVAVEANAQPERLDLAADGLRRARELGASVVVSTDAHRVRELDALPYGVEQARRAGLGPEDVLNTRPLDGFLAGLR